MIHTLLSFSMFFVHLGFLWGGDERNRFKNQKYGYDYLRNPPQATSILEKPPLWFSVAVILPVFRFFLEPGGHRRLQFGGCVEVAEVL